MCVPDIMRSGAVSVANLAGVGNDSVTINNIHTATRPRGIQGPQLAGYAVFSKCFFFYLLYTSPTFICIFYPVSYLLLLFIEFLGMFGSVSMSFIRLPQCLCKEMTKIIK